MKKLVKKEWIKTKLADVLFEVFNADRTKNRGVTQFALLEVEINGHKERTNAVVMGLNSTDIFLEHDQLVKHNLEVNWDKEMIQFTKCLKIYRTKYQDIIFKTRRVQTTETQDKGQQKIGKELDPINLEDLLEYI